MKTIQIPDDVYRRASELALVDHVSVDRLVTAIVKERIDDWSKLQARAARGSLEKLNVVLAKISDTPPEAMDRL